MTNKLTTSLMSIVNRKAGLKMHIKKIPILLALCMGFSGLSLSGCSSISSKMSTADNEEGQAVASSPGAIAFKSYTAERDFDVLATPTDNGKFVLKIANGERFKAKTMRTNDNWTWLRFESGKEGYTYSYPMIENP